MVVERRLIYGGCVGYSMVVGRRLIHFGWT